MHMKAKIIVTSVVQRSTNRIVFYTQLNCPLPNVRYLRAVQYLGLAETHCGHISQLHTHIHIWWHSLGNAQAIHPKWIQRANTAEARHACI